MKILVADDDRISRRMIEKTLQRSGYEVVTAADGLEAAHELSKADGPRLALIDWMMPKLDGPELCREVRNRVGHPYVYILLLTAKELNEDVVTGLEAGADDYLTKPCQTSELKARLQAGRRILQLEDKLVAAREEMRYKATHDSLTALLDRGAILSFLGSAFKQSARTGLPVSLLLCDVDHFKSINDVYGHQTGDEVLQELSSRLLNGVRSTDAVGRYGGEEFLVVLHGCSRNDLRFLSEQVRKSVCTIPFATGPGHLAVSLSAGAITIESGSSASTEQILADVDAALYRAKKAGRNRVCYVDSSASTMFSTEVERHGAQPCAMSSGNYAGRLQHTGQEANAG